MHARSPLLPRLKVLLFPAMQCSWDLEHLFVRMLFGTAPTATALEGQKKNQRSSTVVTHGSILPQSTYDLSMLYPRSSLFLESPILAPITQRNPANSSIPKACYSVSPITLWLESIPSASGSMKGMYFAWATFFIMCRTVCRVK